ncbi:MAG: acyl-CoA dehydrogenase family protein [Eggerthellales bacterium]|nr:acyl-CoA dehydrogenase family protein [Eggerthellales bacterium]
MSYAGFPLTDEQRETVALFRNFGERVFDADSVHRWSFDQGLPDEVVQEFAELYFSVVGEKASAADSIVIQALILEELCRCAGAALPFQTDLFGLQIMEAFSSKKAFEVVLQDYRENGRVMFALAVTEPQAGSDTRNMKTFVKTVDGKLILNGKKTFVNNGEYAPNLLVAAIDADAESDDERFPQLSFWLVPRTLSGISAVPINKIGQSMLPFANVSFEDVELSPTYRLTGDGIGFPRLFDILQRGRVFTCAASLGMAQAAMEDATRYASQREAFGSTIDNFQQIGQMLTDMEVKLWNMRSLVYQAAEKIASDAPDKRLAAALMKRYVPEAATQVASDAMQILGGIGYTDDSRISHIWQDCRGNQLAEGTDQIMVRIASPLIVKKYTEE